MALPSFAKINLALEVLFLRPDGYHELRTLFQSIDLHDTLQFTPREKGIALETVGLEVGPVRKNLVYRAARLLSKEYRCGKGARIRLEKRIPVAAGLGGGSSNAAVTLLGLSRLWGLKADPTALLPLAAQLGSDVPFFLLGGTALGVGRGDEVFPADPPAFRWLVIIDPEISIPTQKAYTALRQGLTSPPPAGKISRLCRLLSSGPWGTTRGFNDFEGRILRAFPRIQQARDELVDHGALAAQMSGSGSAVFGVFPDRKRAQRALSRIEQHPWKAYLTRTVDRTSYWRALRN